MLPRSETPHGADGKLPKDSDPRKLLEDEYLETEEKVKRTSLFCFSIFFSRVSLTFRLPENVDYNRLDSGQCSLFLVFENIVLENHKPFLCLQSKLTVISLDIFSEGIFLSGK